MRGALASILVLGTAAVVGLALGRPEDAPSEGTTAAHREVPPSLEPTLRGSGATAGAVETSEPPAAPAPPSFVFVVAGTEVRVPHVLVQVDRRGPPVNVRAGPDGSCALSERVLALVAEGHGLVAAAGGFAERRLDAPPPGPPRRVELQPTGRLLRISGLVADPSGRPVAGARVVADRDAGGWRTTTGEDGAFDLRVPSEGRVHVLFGGPGWLADERHLDADERDLRIVLRPDPYGATLRLRVVDEGGVPVAGMPLYVLRESAPPVRFDPRDVPGFNRALRLVRWDGDVGESGGVVRTDATGRAAMPHRAPGTHRIRGLARGTWLQASVEVRPPPEETSADLVAVRGRVLRGEVVIDRDVGWHCDHASHPVYVGIHEWAHEDGQEAARLEEPGAFRTRPLPGDEVLLHVAVAGHPLVQRRVAAGPGTAAGESEDLGTIRVPDVRAIDVAVLDADGVPVARGELTIGDRSFPIEAGRARLEVPRPSGPLPAEVRVADRRIALPDPVDLTLPRPELRLPP